MYSSDSLFLALYRAVLWGACFKPQHAKTLLVPFKSCCVGSFRLSLDLLPPSALDEASAASPWWRRRVGSEAFRRWFERLPKEDQRMIEEAIEKLAEDPYVGEPVLCPRCGSVDVDVEDGELLCRACGLKGF